MSNGHSIGHDVALLMPFPFFVLPILFCCGLRSVVVCNMYYFWCVVDAVDAAILLARCCNCRWLTSYREGDVTELRLQESSAVSDVDSYDYVLQRIGVVPFDVLSMAVAVVPRCCGPFVDIIGLLPQFVPRKRCHRTLVFD